MAKTNYEYGIRYLNQQFSAMRWLAKQGMTPEEIREARWGMVDEAEKTISITSTIFNIRYDQKLNVTSRIEHQTEVKIPIKETGHEWFFLKSKFKCPWMFTAHVPKTWRKEGSREALFPLEAVQRACRGVSTSIDTNLLTKLDGRASIEVTNTNVKNMESEKEQVEEAQVIKDVARN